ncbi:hypothetical protein [Kangiella koreensis]|uniref:Uncharacterized protein n=1 Tax=Kangiella koreensis (strain DSM 16069 / JCM 12317 / KCTC 12182 / SW-125) TaxID=523791 RepID=C7R6A8_KANKD|nr:hypothetical protein [Kangiella koreensis]ACV27336.1 hypothetical protein Kkor_1926 [Kangiella koreensis DSM 16069]
MLKAIIVTFIIFAILFSGIIALKRSADHWKVPKGVKPKPYDDDNEGEEDLENKNQRKTPQLEDKSKQKTDSNDTNS